MTNTARSNVFLKKNFKTCGPITVTDVRILRQILNIICSVSKIMNLMTEGVAKRKPANQHSWSNSYVDSFQMWRSLIRFPVDAHTLSSTFYITFALSYLAFFFSKSQEFRENFCHLTTVKRTSVAEMLPIYRLISE